MCILGDLTAVLMKIRVFCNVTSSHLIIRYRRAEGQKFFTFMVNLFNKILLGLLETSVSRNQSTMSNIPEYVNVGL